MRTADDEEQKTVAQEQIKTQKFESKKPFEEEEEDDSKVSESAAYLSKKKKKKPENMRDPDWDPFLLDMDFDDDEERPKKDVVVRLDGLFPESSVDLGEDSVDESDYPSSDHDEECVDTLLYIENNTRDLSEHLKEILKLPHDQVPEKYYTWRKSLMPMRNRDEEALYSHVLYGSEGYEVPCFPNTGVDFDEQTPLDYETVHGDMSDELEGYCNKAIADYNEKNGANYKLKYLIKACGNMGEYKITFAFTDMNYEPYVGRVTVDIPYCPNPEPSIGAMMVTKGEYRVPKWKYTEDKEYKCEVNEEYREKLPELEKRWRQEQDMHLK